MSSRHFSVDQIFYDLIFLLDSHDYQIQHQNEKNENFIQYTKKDSRLGTELLSYTHT